MARRSTRGITFKQAKQPTAIYIQPTTPWRIAHSALFPNFTVSMAGRPAQDIEHKYSAR